MSSQFILTSKRDGYAIAQINRPDVLNALNIKLMEELVETPESLDKDDAVRCIIITGNEKAFAAGADIGVALTCGAMPVKQVDTERRL